MTLTLSKKTGETLWTRTAPYAKIEPSHTFTGPAAPTPVTDGRNVYVYFGSFGLVAYDLAGHPLWEKSLPAPVVEFGAASSPIIHDGKLIVLCDQDLDSFVTALDSRNGREVWCFGG